MYSNSKEQISLEEAYRAVHLEKVEECDCGCGHCEDHKECEKCGKIKSECECDKEEVKEAIDLNTLSQAAHTVGHGYKEIYNAFMTNPEFHDRMMTFWIKPAIFAAVSLLAKQGFDKANEFRIKYVEKKDKVEEERLTKELLKHDEVLIILNKLEKMNKDHQHNTPQYVHLQRSLATEIEKYLKQHSPRMIGRVRSGGIWSKYRKASSFD
jgi:hypothetical protein